MSAYLYLAPIRGITDAIYRQTFMRYFGGFDCAVAPFLTTFHGATIKATHLTDLLPENNTLLPVIPQILSKNPDNFIGVAQELYDLGYGTVNWNLGCPYPRVAKKKRGSGLLPFPEEIQTFLDKIKIIPNSLSIKLRIGRRNPDEIFDLLPIFNTFPLTEIIIHPRTGEQMYNGSVDLDVFAQCLEKSDHPIVYNGDINDIKTFRALEERFPQIKRWMIGRGALADPFLPEEIKGTVAPGRTLEAQRH